MIKRGEGTNLLTVRPEIVFELTLQIGLKAHSDFDFRNVLLDSGTDRHAGTADPSVRTKILARDDNVIA